MSLLGSDQDGVRGAASGSEPKEPGSEQPVPGVGVVILLVLEDSEMRGYLRGCLVNESTDVAAILEADSLPTAKQQAAESSPTLRILARPFNASRLCEAVRTTIRAGAKPNQTRVKLL